MPALVHTRGDVCSNKGGRERGETGIFKARHQRALEKALEDECCIDVEGPASLSEGKERHLSLSAM